MSACGDQTETDSAARSGPSVRDGGEECESSPKFSTLASASATARKPHEFVPPTRGSAHDPRAPSMDAMVDEPSEVSKSCVIAAVLLHRWLAHPEQVLRRADNKPIPRTRCRYVSYKCHQLSHY